MAIACIALFAREGARRWTEIRAAEWRWGWYTVASGACIVLGHVAAARLTHECLILFGGSPQWPNVLRVHLISQAAKYLPVGGLLNVAAQTAGLARLSGVGPRRSALAVVCMTAIVCAGGVSWFGLMLALQADDRSAPPIARYGAGWALLLALPATLLAIAQSWFWRRLAAVIGPRSSIDRDPANRESGPSSAAESATEDIDEFVKKSPRASFARLALLGTATMGLFGASLSFLAAQVTPIDLLSALRLIGCMSAAWVLGFLSFFVPAGMGVRDYSLMMFMRAVVPEPWPVIIPAVSRLVWLATEIACLVAAAATLRNQPPRTSLSQPADPQHQS